MNRCNDCQKRWKDEELALIDDIWQRCDPGDEFPAGQCPKCGALCFVEKSPEYAKVVWSREDVRTLRPKWSLKRCEKELSKIDKYLVDRLIALGWEVMADLLPNK